MSMTTASENKAEDIRQMFSTIARRYDITNTVLSAGIHHIWKHALVKDVKPGATLLDLCTGTGDVLEIALKRGVTAVGLDFCYDMLSVASARLKTEIVRDDAVDVSRPYAAKLVHGDATKLPFSDNTFDYITVAFGVRNIPDLDQALNEMHRVLKPGGRLRILEFGQMRLPVVGALYNAYSKYIMPYIGLLLTGNKEAYQYLPETAAQFPCRDTFLKLLAEHQFKNSSYKTRSAGIAYQYTAFKDT